jgi:hypothetical protein
LRHSPRRDTNKLHAKKTGLEVMDRNNNIVQKKVT